MASERIKQLQAVDLVIEQRYPDRVLRVLSGEDVDDVAPDPESSAPEVRFVAFVLHLGEAFDDFALPQAITDAHRQDHLMVLVAIADTVNTGNRRHDDAIAAFKQAFCRRKAHLLDMLVDRRVFLDKQITCGGRRLLADSSRSRETKYSTAFSGKNSLNSAYNCAANVLFGARISAGRPMRAITLAMV